MRSGRGQGTLFLFYLYLYLCLNLYAQDLSFLFCVDSSLPYVLPSHREFKQVLSFAEVVLGFMHLLQSRCFKRSVVTFVNYINKYKLNNHLGGYVKINLEFIYSLP